MGITEYRETVLFRLTEFFEDEFSNRELVNLFAIGVGGLILCWILVFFVPDFLVDLIAKVIDLRGKVVSLLLFFPFLFGGTAGFALFKFLYRKGDEKIVSDNEFMSGFAQDLRRANLRRVLYASLAVGAMNAILISVAGVWFRA